MAILMEVLQQPQNSNEPTLCNSDLLQCTHLDGIWNKRGLLRNWDKGFTFCFWSQK